MSMMPKGLKYLDISFNELRGHLPNIDIGLTTLIAQGNQLTDLGRLPESLHTVKLGQNPLTNAGELCGRRLDICDLQQTRLKLNSSACGTCLLG